MNAQKAFLLDFDNTLFDTEKLRGIIAKRAGEATEHKFTPEDFAQAYNGFITDGYIDLEKIASFFSSRFGLESAQAINIFLGAPFGECLFPESVPLLRMLGEGAFVYSLGDAGGYQETKINGSGILEGIPKERIIIKQNKDAYLPQLFTQLKEKGIRDVVIVDDKADVLDCAIEASQTIGINLEAVHVAYGRHKDEGSRYGGRLVRADTLASVYQRFALEPAEGLVRKETEVQV